MSRPSICEADQRPLIGGPTEIALIDALIDAYWHDCPACIEGPEPDYIAANLQALMTLRRVCTLQDSGQIRWAYGTIEAHIEIEKLTAVNFATRRQLATSGARIWVNRARMFDEIDKIGTDRPGRLLERPRIPRPGQRPRG